MKVDFVGESWPLAFGLLDGDDRMDSVQTEGVYSTARRAFIATPLLDLWTDAVIADLNEDGFRDAAAISAFIEGVDVFIGQGQPALNRARIDTSAAVDRIAVGDFNGDFVSDLMFSERTFEDVGDDRSTVLLATGNRQGPPGPKVTVGRLSFVQDLLPVFLAAREPDLIEDLLIHSSSREDGNGDALVAQLLGSTDGRMLSLVGTADGQIARASPSSQSVRAGRLDSAGGGEIDLLVARRLGTEESSVSLNSFSVIGGDGTGTYSEADEIDLALNACTRGFDLQTSTLDVAALDESDPVESLFIIDKAPCESADCPATLLVSRGDGDDNECWWSDLVGPSGGVPTDMLVEDIDGNGRRELVVAYGFDATPIRGGVFKDASAAAQETGLAVYWDLEASAYAAGSSGVIEADDAFVGGEVYSGETAASASETEVLEPNEDGAASSNSLAGVRSISRIQADADPDVEVVMLTSDGVFMAELVRPGLQLTLLPLPTDSAAPLQQVVSGDVNGDGVDDLIIAQGARFRVHLGEPRSAPLADEEEVDQP